LMQLDVLARKDDADVGFLKERLEKMRRPLERGLLIVERLRSFSKRSASDEREVVDLHTVVDDAIGICRPKTVGTDVEIALEPGHAPLVRIDVAQMVAALTNVFIHAIESVAGAANGKLSVTIGARDGGAVVDVVTSGAFVQAGHGAGFGGIRELARRHGGTVEVGGTKTGGARVSLWLPGADDERAGVPHA
jgi:two-component system sensor histidine kinase MprB